jgi:hypothetical protein
MALISSGYVTPLAWAVTDVFTVIGQNAYMAPCMSFAGEFVLRLSCSDNSIPPLTATTQLSLHFQRQGAPKT